MLFLRGMQRTHLLPSLPGPLWPGVVAPDRVLSKDHKELKLVFMIIVQVAPSGLLSCHGTKCDNMLATEPNVILQFANCPQCA